MITKFKVYEGINVNLKLITSLFPALYKKSIKNIKDLHESVTEDHVLEFINHYLFNNYGADLTNSKEMYNYLKYLVHKNFIKKNNISESNTVNSKELFGAIRNLNLDKIEDLLNQGADPNVRNGVNKTPIMNAITNLKFTPSKVTKVIELLLKYGADLDAQSYTKRTALMFATDFRYKVYNYYSVVDKLIELGADWNFKDENGDDFIDYLINNGDEDKVKELQEKYPKQFERYNLKKENDKYNL